MRSPCQRRVRTPEPVFCRVPLTSSMKKSIPLCVTPNTRLQRRQRVNRPMKSIIELATGSTELIGQLAEAVRKEGIRLKEVEERIQQYLNQLGSLMVQEVVEQVHEPIAENRVWVDGEEAVFDQVRVSRRTLN